VKIFGGNRHCALFAGGVGGASYLTLDHIETYNSGGVVGAASNNSQIKLNNAGLLMPISNVVMAGNGGAGGASHVGMEIIGGFVIGTTCTPKASRLGTRSILPTKIRATSISAAFSAAIPCRR
jgi:hypothetical protein